MPNHGYQERSAELCCRICQVLPLLLLRTLPHLTLGGLPTMRATTRHRNFGLGLDLTRYYTNCLTIPPYVRSIVNVVPNLHALNHPHPSIQSTTMIACLVRTLPYRTEYSVPYVLYLFAPTRCMPLTQAMRRAASRGLSRSRCNWLAGSRGWGKM